MLKEREIRSLLMRASPAPWGPLDAAASESNRELAARAPELAQAWLASLHTRRVKGVTERVEDAIASLREALEDLEDLHHEP